MPLLPPPHLEGTASAEKKRNSAIAVEKAPPPPPPAPSAGPTVTQPPPPAPQLPLTASATQTQSPATPSVAMTLLGSVSPDDSIVGTTSISHVVESEARSALQVSTGGSRKDVQTCGDCSSSGTDSNGLRPSSGSDKAEEMKKCPSLHMLNMVMTTKRTVPTVLSFKSEIARALLRSSARNLPCHYGSKSSWA